MKVNENDYTCGTCKYIGYCEYLTEEYTCKISGEEVSELDTCDDWTDPEEVELTDDEKQENAGDDEAHRTMVEGREIE